MSRYESSKFIKDPKTMNQDALKQACDKLGWKYRVENNTLFVTDANQKSEMYGEYVLKVDGDTVTYNSYYLDNGEQLIDELKSTFFPLNVEYAKKSVVDAIRSISCLSCFTSELIAVISAEALVPLAA